MSGPRMIPESLYGVVQSHVTDNGTRCIDCLLGGLDEPLARFYLVGGTLLCGGHAQTARMKELQTQ